MQRAMPRWRRVTLACVGAGVVAISAALAQGSISQVQIPSAAAGEVIGALSEVTVQAGTIHALTASLVDETTSPSLHDELRGRLLLAATELRATGTALQAGALPQRSDGGTVGPLALAVLKQAEAATGIDPGTVILAMSDDALAAARPEADLGTGSAVRRALDRDYTPVLTQSAALIQAVRTQESARTRAWSTAAGLGVVGIAGGFIALTVLFWTPLVSLVRRTRDLEQLSGRDRADAAAYVDQLLDGVDFAVLASDQSGRITLNARGRELFGFDSEVEVTPALLAASWELWERDGSAALPPDRLPTTRAAQGEDLAATEMRLVRLGEAGATAQGLHVIVRARPMRSADGRVLGGVTTFQDISELHQRHELLTRHARQLDAISRATRAILREPDARRAVCEAAATVTAASLVGLFEDDGHGDLVCTAAVGADLQGMRIAQGTRSLMTEAFASARVLTHPRMDSDETLNRDIVDRFSALAGEQVRGGAWIPVTANGRCLAVLTLVFTGAGDPVKHVPVLEILASEAAIALQRQDLMIKLSTEVDTDALTGAANRRSWETIFPKALDQARLEGSNLAVIMLDLDHFKDYNDEFGHQAGDALLRAAVVAWRSRLRPGDVLARYGGEEFVVLLPRCTAADAHAVAEALRLMVPQGRTCSAGIASWNSAESSAALIGRADAALYVAKAQGRDRTAVG